MSVKALTPYPTKPGPQGDLNRYVVILRFTVDLRTSPSGDEIEAFVSWGKDPYAAMSAAMITVKAVRGVEVRHVFGVTEWPIPEGEANG